jgi:hypothetical protein
MIRQNDGMLVGVCLDLESHDIFPCSRQSIARLDRESSLGNHAVDSLKDIRFNQTID